MNHAVTARVAEDNAVPEVAKSKRPLEPVLLAPAVAREAGRRNDRPVRIVAEMRLTAGLIALTLAASLAFASEALHSLSESGEEAGVRAAVELVSFTGLVAFLVYGNLVYQFSRLGYLRRRRAHRPLSRGALDRLHDRPLPSLAVLVPSYKEEPEVVRQTLLSAALQEYPDLRVVLLVDDPPHPTGRDDALLLEAARALPREIECLLAAPAAAARAGLDGFEARRRLGAIDLAAEARIAAQCSIRAAEWFEAQGAAERVNDHAGALLVEQVLRTPAEACRRTAAGLRERADATSAPTEEELARVHRRLVAIFSVEVSSFERKRYVNLSGEPNKAMNLNSFIGLIGGQWRERAGHDGLLLEPVRGAHADLVVPSADYILTLDADSLLRGEYALRLVQLMERPGNERLAVTQTPYSAVPGCPGVLERIAGATTDAQYVMHQGFAAHGATFWVGANALIRRAALDDICSVDVERGFPIRRYVQDRTVIEDTESSIDLISRGWQLTSYPQRLSFSATPADFGALVIQRRRWANGGLLILPKLVRYLRRRPRPQEVLLRAHYLTSLAGTNAALLLLLCLPFEAGLRSVWLPLTAVPYFVAYGRDLHAAGYRRSDLVRVYALNLLLAPVNLGGVAKSLHQAITGRKIPFGRTPKVAGRTSAPPLYLAAALLGLAYLASGAVFDGAAGRFAHATYAGSNALLLGWAVTRFVGWRHLAADLTAPVVRRRPPGQSPEVTALAEAA